MGDASGVEARMGGQGPVGGEDGLTVALARRASSLAFADLPEDVVELARQALLDWVGVTLAGSRERAARTLIDILPAASEGGAGMASVVGHRLWMAPRDAALANGTASHALDFDDVNATFLGHASVAVLGAALALGERLDVSWAELLTAFVAGYETVCRVAAAVGPEPYARGFHATGTIGTFGAAAACARLLGLDAQRTTMALGVAASEAAGLKESFGTMTKPLHAGRAGEGGLLAALLGAEGLTASTEGIEGEQGLAAASGGCCDAAAALADGWHLRGNLFKYHAACYWTHSTIEGLRHLREREGLSPEVVDGVVLHVSERELGTCAMATPRDGLEVKFSLAHLAAMALLGRSTAAIGDADALDLEAIALRERVTLAHDGVAGTPTRVDVTLRDGTVTSAAIGVMTPERDLDAQRKRLSGKFTTLAEPVLGGDGADRLLEAVTSLERDSSVRELMALARLRDPAVE